jgi:2-polyprenyl-6-methoxyphenol hydroxylase-like FAD-dependent oxidoreductase
MAEVVVTGAGVIGLTTALLLARRGHEVVVLDRDGPPPDGTPDDDAQRWDRPGVPHAAHAHGFLARCTRVLREEAPDVLDTLTARGATIVPVAFGPGFEDDAALLSRRLVFEATLRRAAEAERGIELRTHVDVRGLVADQPGPRLRIRGVRVGDGEVVPADLVVDAGGRRSQAPRWLTTIGADPPSEVRHPCDVVYVTRTYRVRADRRPPGPPRPMLLWLPYGTLLFFGGDNGTFALGGALSRHDPYARRLTDGDVFERVVEAVPPLAAWLDVGEPITDVQIMAGLANRRRSLVVNGTPVVDGLLLVGDASIYTNAFFGQGISLGLWQAQHVAAVDHRIGDPGDGLVTEVEAWTDRVLGPRFNFQAEVDERRTTAWLDGIRGSPLPEPEGLQRKVAALFALGGEGDEVADAAAARIMHLLAEADTELAEPGLAATVTAYLEAAPRLGGGPGPLPREDFEALVR